MVVAFERGTMICYGPWNTEVHTLDDWHTRGYIWVNIIGLPQHLWSLEIAQAMGRFSWKHIKWLEFNRLDMFRVKIIVEN